MRPIQERNDIYPAGTTFTPRGKGQRQQTVVDHLRTYNGAGELVRFRYVTESQIIGQTVRDYDVVHTTIKMAMTLP